MPQNRIPDARNLTTSESAPQVRHLVVADRAAALGLTRDGQDASTHMDIVSQPVEAIEGWLNGSQAIVVDDGSRLAQVAITKLTDSEIPTVVVHRDRGDQ